MCVLFRAFRNVAPSFTRLSCTGNIFIAVLSRQIHALVESFNVALCPTLYIGSLLSWRLRSSIVLEVLPICPTNNKKKRTETSFHVRLWINLGILSLIFRPAKVTGTPLSTSRAVKRQRRNVNRNKDLTIKCQTFALLRPKTRF